MKGSLLIVLALCLAVSSCGSDNDDTGQQRMDAEVAAINHLGKKFAAEAQKELGADQAKTEVVRQFGGYEFRANRMGDGDIALVAVPIALAPSKAFACTLMKRTPFYKKTVKSEADRREVAQPLSRFPPAGWVSN